MFEGSGLCWQVMACQGGAGEEQEPDVVVEGPFLTRLAGKSMRIPKEP